VTRNRAIRWGAIPISNYGKPDEREMMGTHGSVILPNGERRLAAILSGEYVNRDNFIRFMIDKYGVPGCVYAIYKGDRPFAIETRNAGVVQCMREEIAK
jgi:hypothetical protein